MPLSIFPQEPIIDTTLSNEFEERIENIAENSEGEIDYSDLSENLKYFQRNPINLNNTNRDELSELSLLSDIQINNLLNHIKKNNSLVSLYELQSIDGFDLQTIYSILPYVKITGDKDRKNWNIKDVFKHSKSTLFIRYSDILQEQAGYAPISDSLLALKPNSRYLGSDYKLYSRYKFAYYNLLSFGVTMEKDYGEEFFKGTQKQGFDFYSAHFYIKNLGFLKTLAVGDYNLQFGQGLTLWSGLSFGISAEAVNIKKSGRGIIPYSSVNENLFLRGVAAQVNFKPLTLYSWFSYKKLDASTSSDADSLSGEEFFITTLQESGLHNTQNSIKNKDLTSELITGLRLETGFKQFKIGTTGNYTRFSNPIAASNSLYKKFNFTGNENYNLGVDYSLIVRNINFFGEAAMSKSNGKAFLNGAMLSPDRIYTVSFLHRYFERNYDVFYGSAIQASSSISNEHGLYVGNELKFSRKWSFNSYFDIFSFPWLRYRVDAPSKGVNMLAQIKYKPSKKAEFYFRYRQQNKEISYANGYTSVITPISKNIFRINASFAVSEYVTLKSRAEYVTNKKGEGALKKGFLIYQDVNYRKPGSRIAFSVRYAIFDTDSYDERLYAYENDVLYAYSIPSYYGKGSRVYLMMKINATRNLDFWFRIANTYYSDRNKIGSGLEEIDGKNKTELKIQMRLSF